MVHFLLGSHGTLASGMQSSLNILVGNMNNLTVIDAYVDGMNVTKKFEDFFAGVGEGEQVIMLSDLYGGSVNQLMYQYLARPNTKLISGVNLALVLELVAGSGTVEKFSDETLAQKIEEARQTMKIVNMDTGSTEDTAEDFF